MLNVQPPCRHHALANSAYRGSIAIFSSGLIFSSLYTNLMFLSFLPFFSPAESAGFCASAIRLLSEASKSPF